MMKKMTKLENTSNYYEGDGDIRDWGSYNNDTVLDVNGKHITKDFLRHSPDAVPTYVEKTITVNSKNSQGKIVGILSLQAHTGETTDSLGREEFWTVKSGELTVILNGEVLVISEGGIVHIPMGAEHCMINNTDAPVIVKEIQKGVNYELDNDRVMDASGRQCPFTTHDMINRHIKSLEKRYEADILITKNNKDVTFVRSANLDMINFYLEYKQTLDLEKLKNDIEVVIEKSKRAYQEFIALSVYG